MSHISSLILFIYLLPLLLLPVLNNIIKYYYFTIDTKYCDKSAGVPLWRMTVLRITTNIDDTNESHNNRNICNTCRLLFWRVIVLARCETLRNREYISEVSNRPSVTGFSADSLAACSRYSTTSLLGAARGGDDYIK